jgi:cellulose synthase/poly-beta-1,6-N-acetylglucosamine synthase-like glycosyltransferase
MHRGYPLDSKRESLTPFVQQSHRTAFIKYNRAGVLVLISVRMVIVLASTGPFLQSICGVNGLMRVYVVAQMSGAVVPTIWVLRITMCSPFLSRGKTVSQHPSARFRLSGALIGFLSDLLLGLHALLLASGAFFTIQIWADTNALRLIINWRKSRYYKPMYFTAKVEP